MDGLCYEGQAAETADDAEDVVVRREHLNRAVIAECRRVRVESEVEDDAVEHRTVDAARRLLVLRVETETVEIQEVRGRGRDDGVTLVWLDKAEIWGAAALEALVAVEADHRGRQWIEERDTWISTGGGKTIRVVEPFVTALRNAILLDNPDELRTRVVEVEVDVRGGDVRGDALDWRVLELRNEVIVLGGSEATALGGIQEDVVAVELEARRGYRRDLRARARRRRQRMNRGGPPEVLKAAEVEDQTDGVCLERDQGEGETDVITEPEPEGDHETLRRWWRGGRVVVNMTNHLVQRFALLSRRCQFRPDLHPGTEVLVDLLFADLDADILDEGVSNVVDPEVLFALGTGRDRGEIHLQEHGGQKFGLAGDDATDATAKIRRAVEGDRNGLDGEGRIAPVHLFEEGELGIVREEGILTSTGHQL